MKASARFSTRQWRRLLAGAILSTICTVSIAQQQIKVVVPFGAGGPPDALARILTSSMKSMNSNVYVVYNSPGASGIIGSAEIARAKPDGSALLITTGGHATNAALHKALPFDALKDFTPISKLTTGGGFILLVPASSPYKTVEQLVAAAKAKPGMLSYGSSGIGNTTHLAGALFAQKAGVKLLHVPYKSGPAGDLIGGQIDMVFYGSAFAIPLVKGGKVRALAIAGDKRVAALPDVPTLQERGIEKVDVPAWIGLFGPPGMRTELADKIAQDVSLAMKRPEFISALQAQPDSGIVGSTPAEFRREFEEEVGRLKRELGPLGIEMQ